MYLGYSGPSKNNSRQAIAPHPQDRAAVSSLSYPPSASLSSHAQTFPFSSPLFCRMVLLPMPFTKSSLLRIVRTSLMTARFDLCPMPNTNSSFLGKFRTSSMAACLGLGTMPETNSSFLGIVGTFSMAAMLDLCPVTETKSSLLDLIGASFVTAAFSWQNIGITAAPRTSSLHRRLEIGGRPSASRRRLAFPSGFARVVPHHRNISFLGLLPAFLPSVSRGTDLDVFFAFEFAVIDLVDPLS